MSRGLPVAAGPGRAVWNRDVLRCWQCRARARRLAEGLHERGVTVDVDGVETNFVMIDVGPEPDSALARLHEHGVMLSGTLAPTVMRAVTHLDIDDAAIETAIAEIAAALK